MHNHTDNITIVRKYRFDLGNDEYKEVYIHEFIFKHTNKTRRYCMVVKKKYNYIYEVTEHSASFFDKIINASNGWPLFSLYLHENIDPVPINEQMSCLSTIQKYDNIKELYVIYNCIHNEKNIRSIMKNHKKILSAY